MSERRRQLLICRIGSLEKSVIHNIAFRLLICRIGSLEIHGVVPVGIDMLICRIGSLENEAPALHVTG